jgi:hypothetical protein
MRRTRHRRPIRLVLERKYNGENVIRQLLNLLSLLMLIATSLHMNDEILVIKLDPDASVRFRPVSISCIDVDLLPLVAPHA